MEKNKVTTSSNTAVSLCSIHESQEIQMNLLEAFPREYFCRTGRYNYLQHLLMRIRFVAWLQK